MTFQFATCERNRALEFLKILYPGSVVEDTEQSAKQVLDYVEQDCFRIPDPSMHGISVPVYPSQKWDQAKAADYIGALQKFHDAAMATKAKP